MSGWAGLWLGLGMVGSALIIERVLVEIANKVLLVAEMLKNRKT